MLTTRLELRALAPAAAAALPGDRGRAARELGATLPASWPGPDLLDLLAALPGEDRFDELFGPRVMVERHSQTVVGDLGFHAPPGADGSVEIGYSVIPERRGRGYAGEAVGALVAWALARPEVDAVVAGCDPGNLASIRVLERAGFARRGGRDGEIRWRLEAPAAKPPPHP